MFFKKCNILHEKSGIICHGVNIEEFADGIKNKFPKAYQDYTKYLENKYLPKKGISLLSKINDNLYIASVFALKKIKNEFNIYLDYDALNRALMNLKFKIMKNKIENLNIIFPYHFCCSNTNGDWNLVKSIILNYFPFAEVTYL